MLLIQRLIMTFVILGIAWFAVKTVWTKEVDLLQYLKRPAKGIPVKSEVPEVVYLLYPQFLEYTPGLEVDGISWKEDYKEYIFEFKNKSKTIDISDLRIGFNMPGGIVNHKVSSQIGCENINFSSEVEPASIGTERRVTEFVKSYSNVIDVNVAWLFPEGEFKIKLILKFSPNDLKPGFFDLNYIYKNSDSGSERVSITYKIVIDNPEKKILHIDTENPIEGEHQRHLLTVFDKPVQFKEGKVFVEDEDSK